MIFGLFGGLALCLLLFDFQNVLSRFRGRVLTPTEETTDDFTILVPLYGDPCYFVNREQVLPIKRNVLLCLDVSDPRMRDWSFQAELEGWRVYRMICRHLPPGPSELCLGALASGAVTSRWAIRFDGDTFAEDDIGRAVAAAARADADICSVKVVPTQRERLIERIQGVEYDMSMLSRHRRPWQTSGACIVGRTDAFRHVLSLHSHWFPGEDMETGRIAHACRMRVRHVDFKVKTVVPETWRHLLRQRRLWWAGNFRHVVVNFDTNVRFPIWTLYYVLLVYLGSTGKIGSAVGSSLHNLPVILLLYTGISVVANWQVRSKWMILYPYYSLAHSTLLPLFGLAYYFRIAWKRRTIGRYRFGPRRPPRWLRPEMEPRSA
jgi:cellulose synthase/poly-beta-1,6-N-acetylglucosamine synthase-like glycosyltransferase